jgi:hypothetical protein
MMMLMSAFVGRVTVSKRVTGRFSQIQSIYRYSFFAYLEPGQEARVARICERGDVRGIWSAVLALLVVGVWNKGRGIRAGEFGAVMGRDGEMGGWGFVFHTGSS